jgi:hypothetical protein
MPSLSNEAKYAAMTDVEVIRTLWDEIGKLKEDHDHFYWLTGEIIERWSPEIEMEATKLDHVHDENREHELADHAKALESRAALWAHLRAFREKVELDA